MGARTTIELLAARRFRELQGCGRGRRRRRVVCRRSRGHFRRTPLGDLVATTEGRSRLRPLPRSEGAQRNVQRREARRDLRRRELLHSQWFLGWNLADVGHTMTITVDLEVNAPLKL